MSLLFPACVLIQCQCKAEEEHLLPWWGGLIQPLGSVAVTQQLPGVCWGAVLAVNGHL